MVAGLNADLAPYGVRLSDDQLAQFARYLSLLQEWSARVNLVADSSADEVRRRHFAESIALGAAMREREVLRPGMSMIDIGAGAGFPGIPIRIVWPATRLTLLEATGKKAGFLQAVVEALALEDVCVVRQRAEEAGHDPDLRETFDLAVARAVAPLPALIELALPFLRVGGRLVTPKGSKTGEEVVMSQRALDLLGGRAFVVPFNVPGPPQQLVAVLKEKPTPPAYPRRPGIPAKSPL